MLHCYVRLPSIGAATVRELLSQGAYATPLALGALTQPRSLSGCLRNPARRSLTVPSWKASTQLLLLINSDSATIAGRAVGSVQPRGTGRNPTAWADRRGRCWSRRTGQTDR